MISGGAAIRIESGADASIRNFIRIEGSILAGGGEDIAFNSGLIVGQPLKSHEGKFVLIGLSLGDGYNQFKGIQGDVIGEIWGGSGVNVLYLGPGSNITRSFSGEDVLFDTDGWDTLIGREGNDRILADDGSDLLDGGDGDDLLQSNDCRETTLIGGIGNDNFRISYSPDDQHFNIITDFLNGDDILSLNLNFFPGLKTGPDGTLLPEQFIMSDQQEATVETRIIFDPTTRYVSFDRDGSLDVYKPIRFVRLDGDASKYLTAKHIRPYLPDGSDFPEPPPFDTAAPPQTPVATAGGRHTFVGTGYSESLHGTASRDVLQGQAGNDRLIGGRGADWLYGGTEADRFVFISVKDSTNSPKSMDIIRDFSRDQDDRIDVSAIDASTKLKGNQAFSFIGKAGFHHKAGELRYVKKSGGVFLQGDTDGDGKADFAVSVKNVSKLAAIDLYL
jgi:Ca2+-binding RTX toxin-like protein